jgi:NADH-quinone oxidoreductase subunit C
MVDPSELNTRLTRAFAARIQAVEERCGQVTAQLAPADLPEVAVQLRDAPEFRFAQLTDVCGVDYSTYGQADWRTQSATASGFSRGVSRGQERVAASGRPRFAVVYHLLSLEHNVRLRLRVCVEGDPPRVPSVTEIWPAANWFEREAFDLFGILFEGHPDLRRILTDYGFIGHPFRKDFPLEGNVEVRYDPDKGRVVYQPVSIENRVLVPRVIRGGKKHA